MTDSREGSQQLTSRLYQAYGLKGLYAEDFDLEDVRLRFRNKYGRDPKLIKITAGGGTCLAGPIRKRMCQLVFHLRPAAKQVSSAQR